MAQIKKITFFATESKTLYNLKTS